MAIKGLIDTSAYVLGDYQDLGYYNPQRSIGKYIETDYIAADYFFEESLELSSSFSVSAQGTKDFTGATLTASFSVSVAAQKFDFASGSITSSFSISVSPTRIRSFASSTSAAFTATQQGNATFVSGTTTTTTTSSAQDGNATFRSVLNLPAVLTQTQIAGELFFGEPIDITWESFKESEFIDRTWDEWYGDAWDQGGVLFVINTIAKAKGGYRAFGQASLSSTFTTQATPTRIRSGVATPSTAFTSSVNGNRIASGETSPSASFGITSDYIRIRGFTGSFTGVSSITALAHATFDLGYVQDIQPVFTTSTSANAVFDLAYGQNNTAQFSISANGFAQFTATSSVTAFNTTVSIGRLITIADPFNTIKITQDTRTLVVPIENRTTKVLEQTRVNTITEQSRSIKVSEETRRNKIFRGVLTDRSSIPRVRSEL